MYKDYFGLKEDPFSIAPDPQFLYMSERHREALAHLIYGMEADCGFVLLTGDVGTGKTTVCRCLLGRIPETSEVAFVLNPKVSVLELLATICDELEIVYPAGDTSVKVFVDRINNFLLETHGKGKRTVLIIDEAQNLCVDVLEQIRLLTNLETDKRKLLQVIMLGQPELNTMLERPELRQLAQRITARYHLEPLARNEIAGYLKHRLAVAGVERPLFPKATVTRVYSLTGGVPRLINLLCDRALLGAFVKGRNIIDPKLIKEAAKEVFWKKERARSQASSILQWLSVVLLSLVVFVGAVFLGVLFRQPPVQVMSELGETRESIAIAPPVRPEQKPLYWSSAEPVSRSGILAYQTLFRLWGFSDVNLADGARRQAADLGLNLLTKRGSLVRLQQLNRPAVLKLSDPQGNEFFATLIGLDEETAILAIGADIHKVAVTTLVQQWLGDYGVMWQPPPGYRGVIGPGEQGLLVPWLEQQMAGWSGRDARYAPDMRLDALLLKDLRQFQVTEGLEPDGVVGPFTLILLNNRIGGQQPTLYKTRAPL